MVAAAAPSPANNRDLACPAPARLGLVAELDPDDDTLLRYVVRRYAYDPARHERRHQVVAAFDNEGEFRELVDRLARELRERRAAGEAIDPQEHITGVVLGPGYQRRQAHGRLLRRAVERGALTDALLARLDLPPSVGFVRLVKNDEGRWVSSKKP